MCTTHYGRLLPLGYQGQGHDSFAAAREGCKGSEVSGGHGFNCFMLKIFEGPQESKIDFRKDPAPVVNLVLNPCPLDNSHQLPGEAPGGKEPVAVNLVALNLLGDLPITETAFPVFYKPGVGKGQPVPYLLKHRSGKPVKRPHLQAVRDGDGDQCRVLNRGFFGGPKWGRG